MGLSNNVIISSDPFNVFGLAEYEENIQSIGLAYIYGGYFLVIWFL